MTAEEYNQKIDIASKELAYAKTAEEKEKYSKKLQRLRLQREIALIRKRIEQLS
jgi:hypothetical protein